MTHLLLAFAAAAADTGAAGTGAPAPDTAAVARAVDPRLVSRTTADTVRARPRAIEYSDWYGRRLTVHRWASVAMLPLFGAEYALGDKLIARREGRGDASQSTVSAHGLVAGGVATLFGVNTLTGAWNLYDSRHDPAGRTLRVAHTVLMLAADAGFVTTGLIAERASEGTAHDARTHRTVALTSMGLATVGAGLMVLLR